jgi:predicted PurR-regulated permease PerM
MGPTGQDRFRLIFLVVLVVVISAFFVAMIRQFLLTILLAAIFSGIAQRLFEAVLRLCRGRRGLASAVTILIIVLVIAGPLLAFVGVLVSQALNVVDAVGPWIEEHVRQPDSVSRLLESIPFFNKLEPYRAQIIAKVGEAAGAIGHFLISNLSATTRGTITFLIHTLLLLYAMFFFLRDGREILDKVLSYVPLATEDKSRLLGKFVSVTRATLKGILVIGCIQGILAGIGFAVAGVGGAVLWGTVTVFASMIPGVGPALVWVPTVGYLIATGKTVSGILLAVYCVLVVGSADNLLRPRLVGRDVQMHELLILFGTLGGMLFFGVVGIVIGPLVAALFVTIWEIYGAAFRDSLGSTPSGGGAQGGSD